MNNHRQSPLNLLDTWNTVQCDGGIVPQFEARDQAKCFIQIIVIIGDSKTAPESVCSLVQCY